MQKPSEPRASSASGPELWGACEGDGSGFPGALGGADREGEGQLWRGDGEGVLGQSRVC